MDKETAFRLLKDSIRPDGGLYNGGQYLAWAPGDKEATMDGEFTADDLEAIAWWMRTTEKLRKG